MMDEDYEPKPLLNQDPKFYKGFIQPPLEHISECQTEYDAIKEELPAVCETLDDVIEPKEEYLSDELELENQNTIFPYVADVRAQHSESDSEDEVPLTEFKIEVEEHEVLRKTPKLENVITEEQTQNEQSDTKVIQRTENCTLNTVTKLEDPLSGTKRGVDHFSFDANCSNKPEMKCEKSSKVIVRDRHRSLRVKKKTFKCEICHRSFNSSGNLRRHIRTHTGEKPFKCDVCHRSFSDKSHLTTHIRAHTGEQPYKCDKCQRSFNCNANLKRHIRTHTGEKPFKCDVCHRSFSEKSNLVRHTRTHTDDKPTKCDICKHSFNCNANLTRHIRTHTGEKPFKCDACHRSFSEKNHLTTHIRTHTGEQPYKCDICQRKFKQKWTLTRHIRTHTGEKPYKCDVCQRSFSVKSYFIKHIRAHAGEKS